jgi:hypothetical protein
LFLITVLSTGSYVVSKLYLKSYKKDFKAYVFKNKTIIAHTKIEISKNQLYKNSKQLVWEDENKEIVYKGHLYDIVDIQVVYDKVVLTVVSDKQEMNLKKQFASMYNENDVNQSSQPAKLLKQLLSLKCVCNNDVFEFIKTTNVISFYQSNLFDVQTGVQCVETPPPNFS